MPAKKFCRHHSAVVAYRSAQDRLRTSRETPKQRQDRVDGGRHPKQGGVVLASVRTPESILRSIENRARKRLLSEEAAEFRSINSLRIYHKDALALSLHKAGAKIYDLQWTEAVVRHRLIENESSEHARMITQQTRFVAKARRRDRQKTYVRQALNEEDFVQALTSFDATFRTACTKVRAAEEAISPCSSAGGSWKGDERFSTQYAKSVDEGGGGGGVASRGNSGSNMLLDVHAPRSLLSTLQQKPSEPPGDSAVQKKKQLAPIRYQRSGGGWPRAGECKTRARGQGPLQYYTDLVLRSHDSALRMAGALPM